MKDVLSGRGKRLWAATLVIFWGLCTWRVLGLVQTIDAAALPTLAAVYTTITLGSLGTAVTLLGLDGFAKQIIPAWKGTQ